MKDKGCFLIADEVGLGKTKSAKAVLFEMMRLKEGTVHCIYMASNEDLARQNMTKEFLKKSKTPLAEFQKNNVEAALKKLWNNDYQYDDKNVNYNIPLKELDDFSGRLSMLKPENFPDKNINYIMQLSPMTSFFAPNGIDGTYHGSKDENEYIKSAFNEILNEKKYPKFESFKDDTIEKEITIAAGYEFFLSDKNSTFDNLMNNLSSPPNFNKIKELLDSSYSQDCFRQDNFLKARRILSNAAAALYKPDLIILDEFQRYRNVLENPTNGYSVLSMVNYLNWRNKCQPKVLLLSATPYKMEKDKIDFKWKYVEDSIKEKAYKISEIAVDNPYENLKTLKNAMETLGASGNEAKDFMVRTSRTYPDNEIKFEHDIKSSIEYQNNYLNPLIKYCAKKVQVKDDLKEICKQAYETPHFWRFNSGYSKYATITTKTQKFLLENDNSVEGDVYNNLPLKSLLKNAFDNDLPRLWVPPVSEKKYGSGKTLVFTRMAVSTRCVADYCDKYAHKLVNSYKAYDPAPIKDNTIYSLLENTEIKKAMCDFFNRPFVRIVICAANSKFKWNFTDYNKAIKKYCEIYSFKDIQKERFEIYTAYDEAEINDDTITFILTKKNPSLLEKKELKDELKKFFNLHSVRMAISTANSKSKWGCIDYNDAIQKYCEEIGFEDIKKEKEKFEIYTAYDKAEINDDTITFLLKNTEIKKTLCEFFNRPFVQRVIWAANDKFEWECIDYNEAIKRYCDVYRFKEMINEWLYIKDNDISIISSAFTHKPTSIKTFDFDSQIKIRYVNPEYSEMFVCDDNKSGERNENNKEKYDHINPGEHQTANKLEEICDQFNSPIYPMILVARNSAQEGFNLQYYGDKIMHWQCASTVTAFLQREGRLNRPNSLTLRHKVWQWACYLKNGEPADYPEAVETLNKNIDKVKAAHDNNILTPIWYLNSPFGYNKVEIKQILPIYEYNDKLDDYSRELAAAQSYLNNLKAKKS